jgi:hypothetical protein
MSALTTRPRWAFSIHSVWPHSQHCFRIDKAVSAGTPSLTLIGGTGTLARITDGPGQMAWLKDSIDSEAGILLGGNGTSRRSLGRRAAGYNDIIAVRYTQPIPGRVRGAGLGGPQGRPSPAGGDGPSRINLNRSRADSESESEPPRARGDSGPARSVVACSDDGPARAPTRIPGRPSSPARPSPDVGQAGLLGGGEGGGGDFKLHTRQARALNRQRSESTSPRVCPSLLDRRVGGAVPPARAGTHCPSRGQCRGAGPAALPARDGTKEMDSEALPPGVY